MTPSRTRSRTRPDGCRDPGPAATDPHALVEHFARLILLALIPLRTAIGETHTFELLGLFRHLDLPGGARPATTFALVGLIAAVAALVVCARLFCGRRLYRTTGAEPGAALLLIAGVISFARAGQKHLALIGTLDFLGLVLYLLTLRQLLTRPWHLRLTLVTLLATAGMTLAKCAHQHYVELPATLEYYEAHKGELLRTEAPDGPASRAGGLRHDFEQRLRSGSLTGYYGHPNVLGSHLLLFIAAALAVVSARWREDRPLWARLLPAAVIPAVALALVATRSKGALAALAVVLLVWIVGHAAARFCARRPRTVLLAGGLLTLFAAGCFLAVLHVRPAAFGRSILFRTLYWRGAAEMIADRGLLGVGAHQFGRHFTRYKPAECPEEVESPHSWIVRLAAEWGVIGLAGFLLLLGGVALRLARPPDLNTTTVDMESEATGPLPGSVILSSGGIALLFFGTWLYLLADADPGFRLMTLRVAAAPFILTFVALAIESLGSSRFADDAPGPLLPACLAGLLAFLVHTAIDLALFNAGAATSFFALLAVTLAARELRSSPVARTVPAGTPSNATARPPRPRRRTALLLGLVVTLLLGNYAAHIVRPAARLAEDLRIARTDAAPEPPDSFAAYTASAGYRAYRDAIHDDPLDATACGELIEQLLPRSADTGQVDRVIALVSTFQERDPHSGLVHHFVAALYRRRFEFSRDPADFKRAIVAYRAFVDAYPTSPHRRLNLAELLDSYAARYADAYTRAEAARQLQAALDLDARRIYVSKPNRLSPERIAVIRARIRALTAAPVTPPATAPTP